MIVYLATKADFRADILSNRIEEKIHDSFQGVTGKSVGASELGSWRNSLPFMDRILEDPDIPHDIGVAIEFNIPQTCKRIDMILTGTNHDRQNTATITELKQWQKSEATPKDAVVSTFVGSGAFTETPSNTFGGLIVDEAQRLNVKPSLFSNLGENQVKELIDSSTITVFFLDEDQHIQWKEIGDQFHIRSWAIYLGATVTVMNLVSLFSYYCADGYLALVDRVLQVPKRPTAHLEDRTTNLGPANLLFNLGSPSLLSSCHTDST
ncbi:MAG: DNA/RNA helicase domain-containing protein [Oligoflexus sp.]